MKKYVKKYVVFGGHTLSKNDNQLHKISAYRVAQLYRVNPIECIFISDKKDLKSKNIDGLIKLYPQYNPENYTLGGDK